MPRPENPLTPSSGPVAEFAVALRALREKAGRPQYTRLAKTAGFSPSTLSEAANGKKFPTLDVTLAYASACGGDPNEWRERWEATKAQLETDAIERPAGGVTPIPDGQVMAEGPGHRSSGRWLALAAAATALVIGAAVIVVVASWNQAQNPEQAPTGTPAAVLNVADGADPKDSGCAADPAVETLDSHEIDVDGVAVGLLERRYSPRCGVAWGRITPGPVAPAITKPGPVRFHIDAIHPEDGVNEAFEAVWIGMASYGNVLHSQGDFKVA